MKQKILYIFILFSCTWICILISRHTRFGGYIREQIEEYLVDYSNPSTSVKTFDDGDTFNKDQLRLRSLKQVPQDSIVIILLSDSLQNRKGVLRVIDELMPAEPAVVGVDFIFVNRDDSTEFVSEMLKRSKQYSNLVLAYSRANEADVNTLYPFGVTDYNTFPNIGYTNFGLKGKEVRYLDAFSKVDGELRPAFWTLLWGISHSQSNYKLRSHRRFINFNFTDNDLQIFEIKHINDLHNPYLGEFLSPIDAIKGKMVVVGWIEKNDFQIVPIHDGIHVMPGIYVIGTALNTIVFNENSNNFTDKYRDIIASIVLLLICFLFSFTCEMEFYRNWSNLIQLVLGFVLFIVAQHLPFSQDEVWTVFSVIVVFVLIAPAVDDCYRQVRKKLYYLKRKRSNAE